MPPMHNFTLSYRLRFAGIQIRRCVVCHLVCLVRTTQVVSVSVWFHVLLRRTASNVSQSDVVLCSEPLTEATRANDSVLQNKSHVSICDWLVCPLMVTLVATYRRVEVQTVLYKPGFQCFLSRIVVNRLSYAGQYE